MLFWTKVHKNKHKKKAIKSQNHQSNQLIQQKTTRAQKHNYEDMLYVMTTNKNNLKKTADKN